MADTAAAGERQPARPALTRGELIAAASAIALLVLMFASAWYGVDGMPGASTTSSAAATAEDAWHGLALIRWLMLLTILVALGAVAIHFRVPTRVAVARVRLALLALSLLTAAAVTFRVLIDLPSSDRVVDQKLGGVLGVIAALGIAYGGYEAIREQRARLARGLPASPGRADGDTAR
jgi:uncharacterized BrkB/YihY/UPF0761 family membrane protein